MQTNRMLVALFVLGLCLTAAAQQPAGQTSPSAPAPAQSAASQGQQGAGGPPARGAPVPQAFVVDIYSLIDRLADEMDKEIILDPSMAGRSFYSTAGADADYNTLLAVLRANQYAAIEGENQIRIVPEVVARFEPSPIVNQDDSRISDHAVVTRIIDVSDIELAGAPPDSSGAGPQMIPVLRPLMSTSVGNLAIVTGTNKIILTDRYDIVRRITAIIDALR